MNFKRIAVVAFALLAGQPASALVRLILPPDLSAADPAAVRVEGLPPGAMVELTIETIGGFPVKLVTGRAVFVADRKGAVDLARNVPVSGDYAGADKAGLFWSARGGRASTPVDPAPGEVRVTVRLGSAVAASGVTRVGPAAASLTVSTVAEFPGSVLARPAGGAQLPLIIVLGGSEGGTYIAREIAPLLAARGYVVFGLPYYSPGYDPTDRVAGLPSSFTDIPVDRLAKVRAWALTRADIDARRIGLWGVSKGGEFAMVAASRYPWLAAVAGIVPSDVVWEGWGGTGAKTASFAFDGKPLPFVHYIGMDAAFARMAKGETVTLRGPHVAGREAFPAEVIAARIPLERYHGALLLVAGEQDNVWPSATMVRAIAAARDRAGLSTQVIIGAEAGHGLGDPGYLPTEDTAAGLGGTPLGVAQTRGQAWKATIEMFDRTLKPARIDGGAVANPGGSD